MELVTLHCDTVHIGSAEHTNRRSQQSADSEGKSQSLEDFKDPTLSYSFDVAKSDRDPNFGDHETVIIL